MHMVEKVGPVRDDGAQEQTHDLHVGFEEPAPAAPTTGGPSVSQSRPRRSANEKMVASVLAVLVGVPVSGA